MKPFVTLIRREFWEHRSLWMAPLIAAGFLLLALAVSNISGNGFKVSIDNEEFSLPGSVSPEQQAKMFGVFISLLGLPILITMVVVVSIYLGDALYSERKDRSILFWKSMPVSDASTVWSKVVTALAVVPFYVWVVAMITVTLGFLIGSVRMSGTPIAKMAAWDTAIWFQVQGIALTNMLVASLWYAPVAGYMLAVSAWVRRSVFMWIVLPPVLLTFLEEILFDTEHVARFLAYRLSGFFEALGGSGSVLRRGVDAGNERVQQLTDRLDAMAATELLSRAELWLGVVVAVGLIFLAIRARRYRDDT